MLDMAAQMVRSAQRETRLRLSVELLLLFRFQVKHVEA